MKELTTRKSIRLKDYDYSSNGAYFITICVKDRHELLGTIVGAIINRPQTKLTEYGIVADKAINNIPIYYPNVIVDKCVVMPNHVHLILLIKSSDEFQEIAD